MSGTSGEKHKRSLRSLHDMLLNPTPKRVPGSARRDTHFDGAVRSTQPDVRSLPSSTSRCAWSHGAFDLVDLTGFSATNAQDIVSVRELWTPWTPQALAMKRRKAVSALDISKYEATLKGTSKESCPQHLRECTRRQRGRQEGLRRTSEGNPCGQRLATIGANTRNELHEEIGKGCKQAIGATNMKISKKQGESLATHQHLLETFGERRRRPHGGHLHAGLWECSRWPGTVANQLLRVHSRGRCCSWDRRGYVEQPAPRFLGDRAAPSVLWSRADRDDGAHDHRRLGGHLLEAF